MIRISIKNHNLIFMTSNKLFSPNFVDKGTLAMLSKVNFTRDDKVLDLGCGYGVVGITVAKIIGEERVLMSDISSEAVEYASLNASLNHLSIKIQVSDGLNQVLESNFTKILANVPYHTDFSVAKGFIEEGYKKLKLNGMMILVAKRKKWYKQKMIAVFGGVMIHEVDGYFVFVSEKKPKKKVIKREMTHSKKLRRKLKGCKNGGTK